MNKLESIIVTSFSLLAVLQCTTLSDTAWAQAQRKSQPLTAEQKQQMERDYYSRIPNLSIHDQIPVNFPVPMYPSNVEKTRFSNSTKGSPTAAAMIVTRDDPKNVYQWYLDTCTRSAWSVRTPTQQASNLMTQKQQFMMFNAKKDNQQLSLFCMPNKPSGTVVNISWCKTK